VQNYTFLSKHRLFRFHLGVFYVANPAVRYIFCGEPRHKRMPLPSGLKKIRQVTPDGNSFICLFLNYNSNNKVKEILFIFDEMFAPSVNPLLKKP